MIRFVVRILLRSGDKAWSIEVECAGAGSSIPSPGWKVGIPLLGSSTPMLLEVADVVVYIGEEVGPVVITKPMNIPSADVADALNQSVRGVCNGRSMAWRCFKPLEDGPPQAAVPPED